MFPKWHLKLVVIVLIVQFNRTGVFGQERFQASVLNSTSESNSSIIDLFQTVEMKEYVLNDSNVLALEFGFQKHTVTSKNRWERIKDSVRVRQVDLVYSMYPLRNNVYHEFYPLLVKRINAIISLDSTLNSNQIPWRRILQTKGTNNAEVSKLFHGVVIHFEPIRKRPIEKTIKTTISKVDVIKEKQQRNIVQDESIKMAPALQYMLYHPNTPESLRQTASALTVPEKEQLVLSYFRAEAKHETGTITNAVSQLNYMYELEVFARQFPETDTLVASVLNRHPEWKNKVVVTDWTASMYRYGTEVLLWHLMHLESSDIESITLFNDGNRKQTPKKKVGRTKGIYAASVDNPRVLMDLFNKVMLKGTGGDGPENDVEALLKASRNLENGELILIADNSSCVRDISLAPQLKHPVRIILCGYDPEIGVNPDYVYLASITGGGIYTLENDLEQLQVQTNQSGNLLEMNDGRLSLSSPQCFDDVFYQADGREYGLQQSRWDKPNVHVLNVSNANLTEWPKLVFQLQNLEVLYANNNQLSSLPDGILDLKRLSRLHLENNAMVTLPKHINHLRYLEYIYLDSNALKYVSDGLYALPFLKMLSIRDNQLERIRAFESKFLKVIDFSGNEIHELPNLEQNIALERIAAANNRLKVFPTQLPWPTLRELDLSFNNIEKLPDDLSPLGKLKALNLQGNPIPETERIRIREALFHVDLTF
jgi:Leucine-rich repeat (LRR) protein